MNIWSSPYIFGVTPKVYVVAYKYKCVGEQILGTIGTRSSYACLEMQIFLQIVDDGHTNLLTSAIALDAQRAKPTQLHL